MSNMTTTRICVTLVCGAAAGILLATNPVGAQEDDGTASRSPRVLEEVIVTARKKEEDLQDVPIAITSLSSDEIQRAGITSLAGVAAFTPGLTFSNLFGEFLPVPVIRGVAPTAIFGENNVAVFIDGVFVSGREGLNASQLDLERIEVLKGPQSTKYGRNAFAGAINYVTARPGDELEGNAEFTVGDYDRQRARVSLGGPLVSDLLTGRIAIGIDEWSGSYDNALSNLDIGGYTYKTLQTSLWFTPSDAWDIQWALYLSDDKIDDSARRTIAANCEDRQDLQTEGIAPPNKDTSDPPDGIPDDNDDWSDGPRPQNYCGTLPALPDNVLAINDQSTGEERDLTRSSLNINWDVGFGTIASLTGYSDTDQSARSDSNQMPPGTLKPDGSPRPAGTVPYYYIGANGADTFDAELTTVGLGDTTTEWSQELRFSTAPDKPIRWELGGYWYDVEAIGGYTDFTARLTGDSGQRLPADFAGLFPAPGTVGDAIFGPRFQNSPDNIVPPGDVNEEFRNDTESWSAFSGLEFDLGDRWTVDVGTRYTNDKKRLRVTELEPGTPTTTIDETRRFDYWTGRVGLRFIVSDDNMIYASVSNGKKSGGMDLISGDVICPAGTVCPDGSIDTDEDTVIPVRSVTDFDIEKITAFELGNKGTIADGRARYEVALYYNDWNDILMPQILDVDPASGLIFEQPESVDLTGGDATTWGAEVSLSLILADNWDINLGGSYTNAEYDKAELASLRLFPSFWNDQNGDGTGDSGDISGKELLRQSKWQGNATLNYRKPVTNEWDFYSRTDVLYTGWQWVGAANQAKVPDFTDVNQRFGVESGEFRLELWIENLFDDDSPRAAFRDVTFNNTHLDLPAYGGFSDMFPFRMSVSNPIRRTYGVSAFVNF
jgi:iron complex outermembrane receptor protein